MAIDYGSMYGSANDVQGFGIGNVPITHKPFPTFNKPSPAPNTTITYRPPNGPVGNVPLTTRPFPNLQGPKPKPTGNLSFSFGGGGGGGGGPSVPSNVLNTRQFKPYESTWTPPAAVTPEPYNWATRDPYIYGEGLSNAGAAYDIWGSKPGTNPYLLSTPSDYTPGLLGLDPITLPNGMTNKGANLPNLNRNNNNPTTITDNRTPDQKRWDRIAAYASYSDLPKQELKMASDQYAARYGNEIFNNDKAGLAKMFPETNWDNFATPELRNKNQVTSYKPLAANKTLAAKAAAPKPVAPTSQITSKMDRDYSPPSQPKKYATATFTANKKATAAAVKKYNASPQGKKYSINVDRSKGRIRL
tara:strand:- start:2108 stop:3184 length:1077 start_codon:yes stop_codon:yes gene_type:complete